jgi:PAT family beta-lactamase induction signal transducer AmpG
MIREVTIRPVPGSRERYAAGPRSAVPTLTDDRRLRLAAFTALYFAQGVPWGFISTGYVVLLADLGLDNATVGAAIGLAYLPWSFKILWGPLLDAVPPLRIGRRRPFVIAAELLMGLTLLALWGVDPRTQLPLVSALLFLHNTAASLQDVAVDALAVDLLEEDERGRANSSMWAGKSLGVVLGGGGGTVFAKHFGWGALFAAMAATMWLIACVPLVVRERPARDDDQPVDRRLLRLSWFLLPFGVVAGVMYGLSVLEERLADHPLGPLVPVVQPFAAVLGALAAWPLVDRAGFARLRSTFSFATPWWAVAAAVLTPAGYALVGTPLSRMVRADLHFSEEQIATLSGVIDPASGVVGALVGGWLADRYGPRAALAGTMAALAVCLGGFAATESLWPSFLFVAAFTAVANAIFNAYSAATFGVFMALADPRIGATHFAIYMAATNLTYAWTSPLGGVLADRAGYPALFVVGALGLLAALPLVRPLDPAAVVGRYR